LGLQSFCVIEEVGNTGDEGLAGPHPSWFGWGEKRKVENDLKKTCWEGRDVEPRL
jgi:hypothetical protein